VKSERELPEVVENNDL